MNSEDERNTGEPLLIVLLEPLPGNDHSCQGSRKRKPKPCDSTASPEDRNALQGK
jgi:hypothetical protein